VTQLAGTVPAVALHGLPQSQVSTATSHIAGREVRRAEYSGVEYQRELCHGNGYACGARKAKGTNYCIGHLNAAAKKAAE